MRFKSGTPCIHSSLLIECDYKTSCLHVLHDKFSDEGSALSHSLVCFVIRVALIFIFLTTLISKIDALETAV